MNISRAEIKRLLEEIKPNEAKSDSIVEEYYQLVCQATWVLDIPKSLNKTNPLKISNSTTIII